MPLLLFGFSPLLAFTPFGLVWRWVLASTVVANVTTCYLHCRFSSFDLTEVKREKEQPCLPGGEDTETRAVRATEVPEKHTDHGAVLGACQGQKLVVFCPRKKIRQQLPVQVKKVKAKVKAMLEAPTSEPAALARDMLNEGTEEVVQQKTVHFTISQTCFDVWQLVSCLKQG